MTPKSRSSLAAESTPCFRFVDLFAGIGGMRFGLEAVGGECVYTVEWDRFARQTYEANFNQPEGADINDVVYLPGHDIMAAGFPCQPFSIAGVSKKLSLGREHGFKDLTQGTLFFQLCRLIDDAWRPSVLLFENVKNLVRHDQGRTFEVILRTLDELDYEVAWKVIDARHWVPQHRERTFIVGFDRRVHGGKRFVFPEEAPGGPLLGSILQSRVPDRYYLSEHLWGYLQAYAEKHRAAGNGFGYGLVTPRSVTRTLSARYHKDGSEILVTTRRSTPRRLTPDECRQLMGFPSGFEIPVSDTQAYRQFGNAVVVPVVQHLGRAILDQLGWARRRVPRSRAGLTLPLGEPSAPKLRPVPA